MGDENPIRTLGDYSKPSHEGYRNTIELLVGNNVVPLRSDTIRLVQNGCSFHGLRSEDPNQHLKDFLKLVDSLDLDGENKERTRLGPHDTQYCMEDPEQAFVEYISSCTNEMGGRTFTMNQGPRSFNEAVNACLRTQLGQQQDDMISKVSLLWKTISKNLDDTPLCDTAGGLIAQMNLTSTDYHTKEDLRSKGIKSPSKLLSSKYLSQSSENEAEEEGSVEARKTEYTNRENANETDEEVESEKESGGTEGEKRRKEKDQNRNVNTVKFSLHVGWNQEGKPLNLKEKRQLSIGEFMGGWGGGARVFIGNFTYECDFMVLEDTTSVIDHYLGSVVFGKSFMEATGLVYNKEEGTVMFERDKERIIFKMPHKIDMFKHIDFADRGTDSIPPFIEEI
ncbi:hypothetical protein Tco_1122518 [Tanacetum coccineum]|uniref:MAK10-like protein n=1 Tax=Tanacetum coccineum TaxID=301880 RepID=A0ABQ5J3D3_9ASTR